MVSIKRALAESFIFGALVGTFVSIFVQAEEIALNFVTLPDTILIVKTILQSSSVIFCSIVFIIEIMIHRRRECTKDLPTALEK